MSRALSERIHVQVEQALAYGRTDQWIRDTYAVPQSAVEAVRDYLETVNGEPQRVPRNIARAETASVYSQTVPEHHGHGKRQPRYKTEWERVRLAAAARALRRPVDRRETA